MPSFIIRKVLPKDIWDIYEISNDPTVRKFAINRKPIEREEHIEWFQRVDRELFFVAEVGGKVIGQVRFQRVAPDTFEVSISLHPDWRGKGLGKLLLREGVEKVLKRFPGAKILARIRRENEISKKLFEGFGFEFLREENGIEIYTYEGNRKVSV